MSEVPLYLDDIGVSGGCFDSDSDEYSDGERGVHCRGTSLITKTPPPEDPTVALCRGTYGGPMGVGVSYQRGTPVIHYAAR